MYPELCVMAHIGWWFFTRHVLIQDGFIDTILEAALCGDLEKEKMLWFGIPVLPGMMPACYSPAVSYLLPVARLQLATTSCHLLPVARLQLAAASCHLLHAAHLQPAAASLPACIIVCSPTA